MMKTISYRTKGTCSREIQVTLDDAGIIEEVTFVGGCSGNTAGISRLVVGMSAEEAIRRVKGVKCGMKPTSCPDQLALALEECLAK
jgi:uncharacterized protein (TIGR03905 family)